MNCLLISQFYKQGAMTAFFEGYPKSKPAVSMVLAWFGHHIEDKDVIKCFNDNSQSRPKQSIISIFPKLNFFIKALLFGPKNLIKTKTQYMDTEKYNFLNKLKHYSKPKEVFDKMLENYFVITEIAMRNHGFVSFGSSMKNSILRASLEGAMSKLFVIIISKGNVHSLLNVNINCSN